MIDPRAPVFSAVRNVLPRVWDDPGNILAMDNLLDAFGFPRETAREEWVDHAAPLVEEFEGLARIVPGGVQAYPDPGTGGKPWTIGIGSTTDEHGQPIAPGTVWTIERARRRFEEHLAEFGRGVDTLIAGKPTTARQKAALVSWAYNVGIGAVAHSTLLRKHREGSYEGAAREFARWNRAGGRVLAGLTRRRAAEADLYRSGTP